jgi:hypothetical protein
MTAKMDDWMEGKEPTPVEMANVAALPDVLNKEA